MNLIYEDKAYHVPYHVQGEQIFSLLNIESAHNYYLRKTTGEVLKILMKADYHIQDGDRLQFLRDFFLG